MVSYSILVRIFIKFLMLGTLLSRKKNNLCLYFISNLSRIIQLIFVITFVTHTRWKFVSLSIIANSEFRRRYSAIVHIFVFRSHGRHYLPRRTMKQKEKGGWYNGILCPI